MESKVNSQKSKRSIVTAVAAVVVLLGPFAYMIFTDGDASLLTQLRYFGFIVAAMVFAGLFWMFDGWLLEKAFVLAIALKRKLIGKRNEI